jgi:hypothetical protein
MDYTQEDLDRLIAQRDELDAKIDEVKAFIKHESVGKLEDEYRKLLVGKILVSTNDWGTGCFSCQFISDIAIVDDFRGTKEVKMYVQQFVIDPDHEVASKTDECFPTLINDIPELNKDWHGYMLCDVETILKPTGKTRTYFNECLDKYFEKIMSNVHERFGVYIKNVKKEVKRISAYNKN